MGKFRRARLRKRECIWVSFGDEVRNVRASRQPLTQTFLAVRHAWEASESYEASEALENMRGTNNLLVQNTLKGLRYSCSLSRILYWSS